MLKPTRSRNMAVTYIPPDFSISSFSSCTVFSAFVCPASLLDLGESHPVQHFSWLSLGSGSKTLSLISLPKPLAQMYLHTAERNQFILIMRELPLRSTMESTQSNFSIPHCFVMHFIMVMGSLENCTLVII